MKLLLTLVILVAVAGGLTPALACAHGARGGSAVVVTRRSPAPFARSVPTFVHKGLPSARKSVFPEPVDPWRFWPPKDVPRRHRFDRQHDFDRRHGFASPFSSGFIGAPTVVVTTLYGVDGYGTSPVTYMPAPLASVPAPAAFPTPTLIDYSTGWYQLRGDGVTSPYTWVWIPKAPAVPAPPPEPAPLVRALEPSLPAEPPAPTQRGPAYHFIDERGVTTWTNRLDRVPRRFRDQAAASVEPE